jgi:outer membrane protein
MSVRRQIVGLLLSSALCTASVAALAQDTAPVDARNAEDPAAPVTTLRDALKRAYWSNPTLLAQRAQLRGSDYRLAQARSGYGPQLTVSGTYGYERDNFEQSTGGYLPKSAWTATASAVLTQPLYTFGRTAAAERGAQAGISFGRSSLRAAEARVLLDTIIAYSVLARDGAGVTISRDNLNLLEREMADTATRLRAHEATSTDLQQVETRVGLGRAQLYTAEEQLASSRAQFLRVVGALPGSLAPPNPLQIPVATLDEAYAMAERASPVLAAAYAREKVSRATLDANRADLLPRVDLRGRADSGTITPYNTLRQTTLRGEVTVSAPIFQSGLRQARIDEAREANDADWRLIDAALRDSRAEVAAAWNAMTARHAGIEDLRAAVVSAQAAYDGALLQERAGMRTTLDVLDLARELQTARTALNGAITEAYVAEARLLSAMGSLEAGYLLPDEPLYDPEAHYADARNDGDVPLITPVVRALDGIGHASDPAERPIRDPAGRLTTPAVTVAPARP